jgi:hypothetical protein
MNFELLPILTESLVEIGSVGSEEKIFIFFSSPFFLFLAWRPSWLEIGITGHNFGRKPSKDHSIKVWLLGNSHKNLLV